MYSVLYSLNLKVICIVLNTFNVFDLKSGARPGHMPLWLRWPDAIYVQRLSAVTL